MRIIPFEEIVLGGEVDESAGFIFSRRVFEYNGERLVRELLDNGGDSGIDVQRDYTYNSDGTLSSVLTTGTSTSTAVFVYEEGGCNLNWGNSTHRYFCVSVDGS